MNFLVQFTVGIRNGLTLPSVLSHAEGARKPECGLAQNQPHNTPGVIARIGGQPMKLGDAIRNFVPFTEVTPNGAGLLLALKVAEMEP